MEDAARSKEERREYAWKKRIEEREERREAEAGGTESSRKEEEEKEVGEKMMAEARRMLGVGKTGERTEDIELKWPLGAHSSIPLSLP